MQWHLEERVDTDFGCIAAGSVGTGPPLVLAHGWPWSSYSWHRLIPILAQSHRCFWFDMLGYGQSSKPSDAKTSLDVQGELFAAMINHWRLERPTVIAHDFGGATTLRAHLLGGVDYERLILMNVVAINPWGSDFFDHVGRHWAVFAALPPHIHEAIVRAYIAGAFARPIAPEDAEALVAPWLTDQGQRSFYQQFAQADEALTQCLEPLYHAMRCPVDILWGSEDPWIPTTRGKILHDSIPRSSFTLLEGLGHMPQIEEPAKVLTQLHTLLPTKR